jgi:hypothetical protein
VTHPAPLPATGPNPIQSAIPSLFALPFTLPQPGNPARRMFGPSNRRLQSIHPIGSPLTIVRPYPLTSAQGDPCNCQKPSRTGRERKKRCTNPVISRSRSGDEITITRKIKCPASSRKKQSS